MPNTILKRIQQLHRAEPFKPFQIETDDRRRIPIDRPEFLGIFSKGDRIFYSTAEDTTEVLELGHVLGVRPKTAAHPRGRGKEKRA